MIKAMKFVGVPVSDQQRALDFYTTKLGFRVITDQPFDDQQRPPGGGPGGRLAAASEAERGGHQCLAPM